MSVVEYYLVAILNGQLVVEGFIWIIRVNTTTTAPLKLKNIGRLGR